MARNTLREGFTTGTAAAAAAKAAALRLLEGGPLERVEVPLPEKGRLSIPVAETGTEGDGAYALVIKDGGDDPDATHLARIRVSVRLYPGPAGAGEVEIRGGRGVGRVTRPGLPVGVGEAAINPAPRRQIKAAVAEALNGRAGNAACAVVTVEVDDGERIAAGTLNPRLGVVGGISILGTRGTVKPFSHKAYRETIRMAVRAARAQGCPSLGLATGGRSERLLRELRPELPDAAWVQVADFFAFSLREAGGAGFREVMYACFFGKLVKMAQGHPSTHAGRSRIDFRELGAWCAASGVSASAARAVSGANTSREALSIIRREASWSRAVESITARAAWWARSFVGGGPRLTYYVFDFDRSLLGTHEDPGGARGAGP